MMPPDSPALFYSHPGRSPSGRAVTGVDATTDDPPEAGPSRAKRFRVPQPAKINATPPGAAAKRTLAPTSINRCCDGRLGTSRNNRSPILPAKIVKNPESHRFDSGHSRLEKGRRPSRCAEINEYVCLRRKTPIVDGQAEKPGVMVLPC